MHILRVSLNREEFPALDCYPFNLDSIRLTGEILFDSPIVFLVGENGTGKSTLLRAIARRCGIHIWENPDAPRVILNPYEERLCHYLEIGWAEAPVPGSFFSAEHFRYFSERLEDWAGSDPSLFAHFGGKSLLTQSHGQSLMSFFAARYQIEGLYFLDEPESALSPRRQLELLRHLHQMAGEGHAQFVVATHSPILMSCPDATLLSFDHGPIAPIEYRQTDHYTVFRDFINDLEAACQSGTR